MCPAESARSATGGAEVVVLSGGFVAGGRRATRSRRRDGRAPGVGRHDVPTSANVGPPRPSDDQVSPREPDQRRKQLWLLAREGEAARDTLAEVAVRTRTFRLYHYAIPAALRERVRPGTIVRVPYGRANAPREGWCVRVVSRRLDHTLKSIEAVSPLGVLLTPAQIELGLWVSDYYLCPPAQTLDALVPAILRNARPRRVRYVRRTAAPPSGRLSDKQRALLETVGDREMPLRDALGAAGVRDSTARALVRRGLLEIVTHEEVESFFDPGAPPPAPADVVASPEDAFTLTSGQRAALDAIHAATTREAAFRVFLLFGVPGSGKTEVYVRAIRRVIAAGRQAILLVPEIALATQVVERLARRFARVAVVHSRLKATARRDTLRAIASGAVDVVIGTRTAVFAPCPRLGLIVVDEEQESSFKNLQAPFFHARDVAVKRGQLERIPVVLGSATPALETWHNAATLAHYELLRLPDRVPGARLPAVRVVQVETRQAGPGEPLLAPALLRELRATLSRHQQAILLHNRRGYAVFLRCARCGMVVLCPRCGAHMVYHRSDDRIKCHRCGVWQEVPRRCLDDTCGGPLQRSGAGIQRIEQELARRFPDARLLRLDSDTMRRREDYAEALECFAGRAADVLIGTQMVAKGLDFPAVRLVGVLDADAAVWLPDFRAPEMAFQLLVQVVGRAGRKEGDSIALLQAEDPGHPVIRAACAMDYEAFAAAELGTRRAMFDPPFSRLVRLICADPRASRARDAAAGLARALRRLAGRVHADIRVDEPEDCVVPRLREMFRVHLVLRFPRSVAPGDLLRRAAQEKLLAPRVQRFTIDVDPLDML